MVNEKKTDQWVRKEIEQLVGENYTEQTSDIKEVKNALKNASKQGGRGVGKPEFVFLLNQTLVVIEDKPSTSELVKYNETGELDLTVPLATAKYAVNGAVHYAKHITEKALGYQEVLAIGATGSHEQREVEAWFVEFNIEKKEHGIKKIGTIINWSDLSPEHFDEWYAKHVLGIDKESLAEVELKSFAAEMHEDLRNYANLEGENKATVVSAILLALSYDSAIAEQLNGRRDGVTILRAVEDYMDEHAISPNFKKKIVLDKFRFLENNVALNAKSARLGGKTPVKYFTDKLTTIHHHFQSNTNFDILGNFYGEFTKYGGSDGNSLGIVLTPRHITSLMADLIDVQATDYVLDPTAGSGAFLIAAMNRMIKGQNDDVVKKIKQEQLHGIEMQEKMYTVATTNMILRGDGKANLLLADVLTKSAKDLKVKEELIRITKVLMNPPYSQGSKANKELYEINFIRHSLSMMEKGGLLAALVPQSTMTGKTTDEKNFKKTILEKHSLETVITLNPQTFAGQRAGVQPVIAIFKAGVPHHPDSSVKFIDFRDDGYVLQKHVGLVADETAKQKRDNLLKVVLHKARQIDNEPIRTKYMVESPVTYEDEWLHSFFYFNDEIPTEEDFAKTIADYLTFEVNMITHGRGYLFGLEEVVEDD